MATYSLAHVIRQISPSLLRSFFAKMNIDTTGISWDHIGPQETKPLLNFLFELPDEVRLSVEGTLREVHEMASFLGMESFNSAAKILHVLEWSAPFTKRVPLINKALWVWIYYKDMFDFAKSMHLVEHASWWSKRMGLPHDEPQWNPTVKENLESQLEEFFLENQGRGHRCTVEMQNYGDCMYYFLAYTDDYVQNILVHDDSGEVVSKKTRPTFIVIYAYNMNEGSLEIHVQGTAHTRKELEDIFIETIFGESVEPPKKQPYDLSMFKNPYFTLATNPLDNVEVLVKELKFRWESESEIKYIADNKPKFIEWVKKTLNEKVLSLEMAEVVFAKLQFVFPATEGTRRGTLTFEISVPNRCTLQGKNPKYSRIINKYLKEWKISNETESHELVTSNR